MRSKDGDKVDGERKRQRGHQPRPTSNWFGCDQRSNAGVPGVAAFRSCRAQALAEPLEAVGHGEPVDELALVAELPRNPHEQRNAERGRQVVIVLA